jgi:hypothetical protein
MNKSKALIWPNIVKFSEGQKETPYSNTNTNSNYTQDFCGKHNITADVEVIPIQKVYV